MEQISGLIFGILSGVITSAIIYGFKHRQLYLVITRKFTQSKFQIEGDLMELRVINRGNITEDDISVSFPTNIELAILGSDSEEVTTKDNILKIRRLPGRHDVSIMLVAKGSSLSESFKPRIISKEKVGKCFDKFSDVPENRGLLLLYTGLALILFYAFYVFSNAMLDLQKEKKNLEAERRKVEIIKAEEKNRLDNELKLAPYKWLDAIGWINYTDYVSGAFKDKYATNEFPLNILDAKKADGTFYITFEVINKSDSQLEIDAGFSADKVSVSKKIIQDSVIAEFVEPTSIKKFVISTKIDDVVDLKQKHISFFVGMDNDGIVMYPTLLITKHPIINSAILK